jgi:DNA-binding FadR family transcriptional regulator
MPKRQTTGALKATEKVLYWIENLIREENLSGGSPLPKELEIARACRVGRSSVREALTALKVLGIIVTRRRGGIRIVRDPVLLELRHYFAERYASSGRLRTAMEFRAAMERGLSEVVFTHIHKSTVTALEAVLERIRKSPVETADLHTAETQFHTLLMNGSGNELAALFSHIYRPVFGIETPVKWTAQDIRIWLQQHSGIVNALKNEDSRSFVECINEHTKSYMRI